LYAAEAQVQLIAALIPIFIAALAIASFFNGFWMSVGGYFIKYVSVSRDVDAHPNRRRAQSFPILLLSCLIFGR
jgi:hypothetical protein